LYLATYNNINLPLLRFYRQHPCVSRVAISEVAAQTIAGAPEMQQLRAQEWKPIHSDIE
jgi:hypothetical protein